MSKWAAIGIWLAIVGVSSLGLLGAKGATARTASAQGFEPGPSVSVECDAPDADPWIGDARDRSLRYSTLVQFAVAQRGAPTRCQGEVTSEFDGMKFGTLKLNFGGGLSYELETMPLETSIVTLTAPAGFPDEDAAVELLRAYAEGIGLTIAWDEAPEVETAGDEVAERFWDSREGLNASAVLVRSGGLLTAIRVSMAL